jgi:putative acetyltransferase
MIAPAMKIRPATIADENAVRSIYESAFPVGERDLVAKVAIELLCRQTAPPTLAWVAESDHGAIAHIAFSPVWSAEAKAPIGYLLAPLAVKPDHQRRGIGSRLVQTGLQQLSLQNSGILLVYGDPKYYSRFGFTAPMAEHYLPPYPLQHSHGWQGLALGGGSAAASPLAITCVPEFNDPTLW